MSEVHARNLIRAGLARQGNLGSYDSLVGIAGAPFDHASLNQLVIGVLDRRTNLKATAENISKQMAAYEARRWAELKEQGVTREASPMGGHRINDLWTDNGRRAELAKNLTAKRKELMSRFGPDRDAAMKANADALEKLKMVRSSWEDPVALLHRSTIGESSRRIYRDNLSGARGRTLETAMKTAVATGNKAMLAAALDVLDALPPEDQAHVRISRKEAAGLVLGEDYLKVQRHLIAFDVAMLESQLADAEISDKPTSTLRLDLGIKKKELQAWHGEIDFAEIDQEVMNQGGDDDAAAD